MSWSVRCKCRQTSWCTLIMFAPAAANSGMKASGLSIIRWQSSGSLVIGRSACTIGGPKVIFGTKWPSITSTWTIVPPPRSAAATSSARCAKSEASIENASSIKGSLLPVSLSAQCEDQVATSLSLARALFHNGDGAFDVGTAFVEDTYFGLFGGLALDVGQLFGFSQNHPGCSAQNAANWPCFVGIW